MIWERLLTDTDGQYVEVQSGRLFNQSAEAQHADAVQAPRLRAGHSTDTWTEYWFPVKGTKGFVKANDLGALNVTREGERAGDPFLAAAARDRRRWRSSTANAVVFGQARWTPPLQDLDDQATARCTRPTSASACASAAHRFEYLRRRAADDGSSRPLAVAGGLRLGRPSTGST